MKICCAAILCTLALNSFSADVPLKIICFGDSITEGKTPGSLKAGERWIEVLQQKSIGQLECFNEGKGGRPAAAVNELEPALKRHGDADILLIALGTNDSRDYDDAATDRLAANISKMLDIARKENPKLRFVLCAPYNINIDALKNNREKGPQRRDNLISFGKAIEKLSREHKTMFINFYGLIPESSLKTDGVHPDAAGHAEIAAKAWEELRKQLNLK